METEEKNRVLVLIFFLIGFFLSLAFLFLEQGKIFQEILAALKSEKSIISPLGKAVVTPAQVLGEITTLENTFDFGTVRLEEGVLAEGAFVYDLTNEKVVFEKDSRKHLQAASTMKIVTAAVALDKGKLEEKMTVNYFPTVVGESSMNLAFGEKFTLKELLYGLLLVSGNDAAETIALGIAGKREVFVSWLNEFAKKVGAKDTVMKTASGLDEDSQYTCAYDLFLLGRYAFDHYPLIWEISTAREKYLPESADHRSYLLRNKLLLLDLFPILAGKPGLGEGEMLSLVCLLEKDGKKILAVFIRTPSLTHDLTQVLKKI